MKIPVFYISKAKISHSTSENTSIFHNKIVTFYTGLKLYIITSYLSLFKIQEYKSLSFFKSFKNTCV